MSEDLTPGEVGRAVAALTESMTRLTDTVSDLAARDKADLLRFKYLDARLAALEALKAWAVRIVLALVLTAVVGGVLVERTGL